MSEARKLYRTCVRRTRHALLDGDPGVIRAVDALYRALGWELGKTKAQVAKDIGLSMRHYAEMMHGREEGKAICMNDDLSLEARISDLEALVSGMADLLSLTLALSLALMNLLDRKKLLDHTEVAALMKQIKEDSDFAVEFGPE